MFPVLFSIGSISVSSFGVFLALGFLLGIFLVWRLARAWDLSEEKILDLTLLTFLGGLIGARVYFVLEHWQFFAQSPLKIIIFTKFAGFSFWGGFLGGWLSLYYFARKLKWDFWQVADIASVGFLGGLILSDFGCLLGGCGVGVGSKSFIAVAQVGSVGKRLPVQGLEGFALIIILMMIWSQATHFHQRGRILSLSLICIGAVKLLTEPFRQVRSGGYIFSATLVILGITIFYRVTKRNIFSDFKSVAKFLVGIIIDRNTRKMTIDHINKTWYNQKTAVGWKLRNLKKVLRRFNVRFSHKNSKIY